MNCNDLMMAVASLLSDVAMGDAFTDDARMQLEDLRQAQEGLLVDKETRVARDELLTAAEHVLDRMDDEV